MRPWISEKINQKNVVVDFSNAKFNIFINPDLAENDVLSRKIIENGIGEFYKKQSIKNSIQTPEKYTSKPKLRK